jgi:hypothetical protein
MDDYVFGYGSLVDVDSMAEYLGRKLPAEAWRICHLHGYRRCWNLAMDNTVDIPGYKCYVDPLTKDRPQVFIAFLNIRPAQGHAVNGIVFRICRAELSLLDTRERNYERTDVTAKIVPRLPGRVWTYAGSAEAEERYRRGLHSQSGVIDQDYYERVRKAFLNLGSGALAEYELSTDAPEYRLRRLHKIPVPCSIGEGV